MAEADQSTPEVPEHKSAFQKVRDYLRFKSSPEELKRISLMAAGGGLGIYLGVRGGKDIARHLANRAGKVVAKDAKLPRGSVVWREHEDPTLGTVNHYGVVNDTGKVVHFSPKGFSEQELTDFGKTPKGDHGAIHISSRTPSDQAILTPEEFGAGKRYIFAGRNCQDVAAHLSHSGFPIWENQVAMATAGGTATGAGLGYAANKGVEAYNDSHSDKAASITLPHYKYAQQLGGASLSPAHLDTGASGLGNTHPTGTNPAQQVTGVRPVNREQYYNPNLKYVADSAEDRASRQTASMEAQQRIAQREEAQARRNEEQADLAAGNTRQAVGPNGKVYGTFSRSVSSTAAAPAAPQAPKPDVTPPGPAPTEQPPAQVAQKPAPVAPQPPAPVVPPTTTVQTSTPQQPPATNHFKQPTPALAPAPALRTSSVGHPAPPVSHRTDPVKLPPLQPPAPTAVAAAPNNPVHLPPTATASTPPPPAPTQPTAAAPSAPQPPATATNGVIPLKKNDAWTGIPILGYGVDQQSAGQYTGGTIFPNGKLPFQPTVLQSPTGATTSYADVANPLLASMPGGAKNYVNDMQRRETALRPSSPISVDWAQRDAQIPITHNQPGNFYDPKTKSVNLSRNNTEPRQYTSGTSIVGEGSFTGADGASFNGYYSPAGSVRTHPWEGGYPALHEMDHAFNRGSANSSLYSNDKLGLKRFMNQTTPENSLSAKGNSDAFHSPTYGTTSAPEAIRGMRSGLNSLRDVTHRPMNTPAEIHQAFSEIEQNPAILNQMPTETSRVFREYLYKRHNGDRKGAEALRNAMAGQGQGLADNKQQPAGQATV